MRHIFWAVVFSAWAGAAAAIECSFTTECFEAEACAATQFDATLDQGAQTAQFVTPSETILMSQGGSETVRVYVGVTGSAFHILTRGANGIARYTTHIFEGPLAVSYLGECET